MYRGECGFSRLWKDGGGPGVGPLAPVDPWVGSDVHVDIPGGDRRNRRRQGIGVAPSVHKAADCPDGEHMHDRFDYCHPEERKHRGAAKQEGPKRPFPPARTIKQKSDAAFKEWYHAKRERTGSDLDVLYGRYQQLRELYNLARMWERSPEGVEWVTREKVKRAKGQGKRGQEYYEARAEALNEKYKELQEKHEVLWEKYQVTPGNERYRYLGELHDNTEQMKKVSAGIARAKSYATIGFARDWTDIIKKIAGGTEPQISAIRTGSNSFAHYSMDSGIIGISDHALERLGKIRDDPELLFSKGTDKDRETYAFVVSALFHEFLHSVNPAVNAYVKDGITGMIEEGLTEAIANRMVARPDVLSSLLGRTVEEGIIAKPGTPQYAIYVQTMEYMAERAAQKHNTDPEWFLGKWKFHTPPHTRGDVILDDASIPGDTFSNKTWRGIITEAREKLPGMQEARQATRMNKSFRWAVQQALFGTWDVPVFKVAGGAGSYEPYPPSSPAPTGGGGGGPAAGSSALVPSNVDVRYTGSPPKGVGWTKFPRQGGESVGGAGAGAVEAALDEPCEKC